MAIYVCFIQENKKIRLLFYKYSFGGMVKGRQKKQMDKNNERNV